MNSIRIAKSWIEKRLSLSEDLFSNEITPIKTLSIDTKQDALPRNTDTEEKVEQLGGMREPNLKPAPEESLEVDSEIDTFDINDKQIYSDINSQSDDFDCSLSLSLSNSYSYDSLTSSETDFIFSHPLAADAHSSKNYLKYCKGLPHNQPISKRIATLVVSTIAIIGETFSFSTPKLVGSVLPSIEYPKAVVTYIDQYLTDRIESDPDQFNLFQMIIRLTVYGPWVLSNQSTEPVYSTCANSVNLTKCMVYSDKRDSALVSEEMSFGFAACSWLLPYELGAAQCIQDSFRKEVLSQYSFIGSQTGVVPAIVLALNLDSENILNDFAEAAVCHGESFFKGATSQLSSVLEPILEKHVPKDISQLGSRLKIVCSEFPSGKERIVSQFKDREELIQYALASCSLPMIGKHSIPIENGASLVSNQFSNKRCAPVLNDLTMTVQPFHGLANICPETQIYEPRLLWQCSDKQGTYFRMFEDGYKNSKDYFEAGKKALILSERLFKPKPFGDSNQAQKENNKEMQGSRLLKKFLSAFSYFESRLPFSSSS